MLHILVNEDNSVNFMGDSLEHISTEGLRHIEIADKTDVEMMKGIPAEHCVWDWDSNCVEDDRERFDLLSIPSAPSTGDV